MCIMNVVVFWSKYYKCLMLMSSGPVELLFFCSVYCLFIVIFRDANLCFFLQFLDHSVYNSVVV